MKISLINPPFYSVYRGFNKVAKVWASYPPLGLYYIASKLRSEGHQIQIIDAENRKLNIDGIVNSVHLFNIK